MCLLSLCCFFVCFCILCGWVRVCSCGNLTLWYGVHVCHQYDVCKNYVGSVYVAGYGGLSERGLP